MLFKSPSLKEKIEYKKWCPLILNLLCWGKKLSVSVSQMFDERFGKQLEEEKQCLKHTLDE